MDNANPTTTLRGSAAQIGVDLSIGMFAPAAAKTAASMREQLVAQFGADNPSVASNMRLYWAGIISGLMGLVLADLEVDGAAQLLHDLADKMMTKIKARVDEAGGLEEALKRDAEANAAATELLNTAGSVH